LGSPPIPVIARYARGVGVTSPKVRIHASPVRHFEHIGNSSRYRGRCPTRVGRAGALARARMTVIDGEAEGVTQAELADVS